ncbi:hypothetical protein FB45DRAFT_167080 [Roridomyces roridus]|uniref:Transmembrane protein n=1 Tax=Roridomyces roridus TaxID=1738132 RepID=A0AAD7BEH5_9AGAR|nr:hypothetical protein FB45DRAFT_167080 [Roridomyces roridus]
MPFADALTPAQNHVVAAPHPSLKNLGPFGYIALVFIIVSVTGVFCYASYNLHHALNRDTGNLPQYAAAKTKTKRATKKKLWRPSTAASCSQQEQPILSTASMDFDSTERDPRMSLAPLRHAPSLLAPASLSVPVPVPALAFPSTAAMQQSSTPKPLPPYDRYKIRYASPSATALYAANPKLAPVQGTTIPLSPYASNENLFPNFWRPVAMERDELVGVPGHLKSKSKSFMSSISEGFRGKGKGKGRASNKENYGVRSDVELMPLNVVPSV